MNDQRTHKYLITETPNISFIWKKKKKNPEILIYVTVQKNKPKKEKAALAAHPQSLAPEPWPSINSTKQYYGYNLSFNWHKLIITAGLSKMIKIY